MGKRKKQNNELDAILEQLKRSYVSDINTDLEDSLLEEEESEEDSELSSILAKIFSDESSQTEISSDILDDSKNNNDLPESEIIAADENTDISVEEKEDEISNTDEMESDTVDHVVETVSNDDTIQVTKQDAEQEYDHDSEIALEIADEQQKVDSVLNAMLRGTVSKIESAADDTVTQDEPDTESKTESNPEKQEFNSTIISNDPLYDTAELEIKPDPTVLEQDIVLHESNEDADSDIDVFDEQEDDPFTAYDEQVLSFEDSEYPSLEQEQPEIAHIVLDPDEYTHDPLQLNLSDLKLLKFDEDISEPEIRETVKEDKREDSADNIVLDGGDVSLLVKFGYGQEVDSQMGRDAAKKAFFDRENNFKPERFKVPFGFTGKEFSGKDQIDGIRQKYKSDRVNLLLMLISVSVFTFVSFITGLIFEFSPNKLEYYLPIMSLDFLLIATSALICIKRIISGAIAVSRFEANAHSVLLITSVEYLVYNILSSVIYVADPILMHESFTWISGCYVLAYFTVVILCDLIRCDKEFKTFELMANSETIYTAERFANVQISDDPHATDGYTSTRQGAFKIRKASMIGGYFKKTYSSKTKSISPIYMLGIVPSIALIISCCTSILTKNAVYGIHIFMMISILCMPLPCICLGTFIEYLNSRRHINNNAAFIGHENENEFINVSLLIFDDTDAIEITSCKEINPEKNSADTEAKLRMAYNVLKTLGGPLGQIVPDKHISKDGHELIINSISDNGINIYFDSSTNILIGDKQYMLSHNLKVKTDINLTTATKGADRYVIYMAFDGKPQLGFVLTERIKSEFSKIAAILNACQISICIESYEPEVNDMYFDQNKVSDLISVYKPSKHQNKAINSISDSTIMAKDALSLTRAIAECKNLPLRTKRIKHSNILCILIGALMSVLIALIVCVDLPFGFINIFLEHPTVTLYIAMILSAIPAIINTIKERSRK